MATLLALLSLAPVGLAAMITGDFSQMVYKPSRKMAYFVLRYRYALIGASVVLWLAALAVHIAITPVNPILLVVTGVLVVIQVVLGFIMSPYVMFPSIRSPRWLAAAEADAALSPEEPVIGLEVNGDARAFPVKWTFRPHIVEDTIGGEPVAMTYCLLSNLGLAFRPELGGERMHFIMPIQWENNMMIYDTRGGRLIQQIDGKVMYGPDAGQPLQKYPTCIMSWAAWRGWYPETCVLHNPPGGLFDRFVRFFIGRFFLEANRQREAPMFPTVKHFDARLPNKTEVVGIEHQGAYKAYALDYLCKEGVVNDTLGDLVITLVCDVERDAVNVFHLEHAGETHTFQRDPNSAGLTLRDVETGSQWDVTGRAVSGPAQGAQLEPYAHFSRVLWFIWANFSTRRRNWRRSANGWRPRTTPRRPGCCAACD